MKSKVPKTSVYGTFPFFKRCFKSIKPVPKLSTVFIVSKLIVISGDRLNFTAAAILKISIGRGISTSHEMGISDMSCRVRF